MWAVLADERDVLIKYLVIRLMLPKIENCLCLLMRESFSEE